MVKGNLVLKVHIEWMRAKMSTCRPIMGKVVGHEMPRTSQALVLEDFHEVPTERSDKSSCV